MQSTEQDLLEELKATYYLIQLHPRCDHCWGTMVGKEARSLRLCHACLLRCKEKSNCVLCNHVPYRRETKRDWVVCPICERRAHRNCVARKELTAAASVTFHQLGETLWVCDECPSTMIFHGNKESSE